MKTKVIKQLIARLEAQLDSPYAARFNMSHFGAGVGTSRTFSLILGALQGFPPVCKTQACLAGETVLTTGSGHLLPSGGIALGPSEIEAAWAIRHQADKDLELTPSQSRRLFFFEAWNGQDYEPEDGFGNGWPEKFEEAYRNAKTPQGRLYVAIRRVEHFLRKGGRE
jgi:hypothetical protein